MPIIELVLETTAKAGLSTGIKGLGGWLKEHGARVGTAARCLTFLRSSSVRVSFSELLQLRTQDGYVLVRNTKRPQQFGPLGGVVRIFPASSEKDDLFVKLRFKAESSDPVESLDLRGFVTGKHLPGLVAWYEEEIDREQDCLHRELKEELHELGVQIDVPRLPFQPVRTIDEGPYWTDRGEYYQYRRFNVLRPDTRPSEARTFWKDLEKAIHGNANIISASSEEIVRGRTKSGDLIGNHSCYLLSGRRIGAEAPLFHRP